MAALDCKLSVSKSLNNGKDSFLLYVTDYYYKGSGDTKKTYKNCLKAVNFPEKIDSGTVSASVTCNTSDSLECLASDSKLGIYFWASENFHEDSPDRVGYVHFYEKNSGHFYIEDLVTYNKTKYLLAQDDQAGSGNWKITVQAAAGT